METPGIAELPRHIADRGRMIWVDLEDPTDEEVGVLGGIFGFHVLAVEDCLRDYLLPKFNPYEGYLFQVVHAPDITQAEAIFKTLEVNLFMGANYLVTHHKKNIKSIFDTRGAVAKNPGSLLRSPDWLLHGVLDVMIDNYTPVVTQLENRLESLVSERSSITSADAFDRFADLNQEIGHLKQVSGLQKKHLEMLIQSDLPWIAEENRVYFRDLYDRMVRISQTALSLQERFSGITTSYLLLISEQTQGAVKMLTVVAALVLPLSFLMGLQGFGWNDLLGPDQVGSAVVLGLMVLYLVSCLVIFKKKGWF